MASQVKLDRKCNRHDEFKHQGRCFSVVGECRQYVVVSFSPGPLPPLHFVSLSLGFPRTFIVAQALNTWNKQSECTSGDQFAMNAGGLFVWAWV